MSVILFCAAAIGLVLYFIQLASTARHLRQPIAAPPTAPAISILKPLCGIDDELAENLEHFAQLPYPRYELLLGVKSRDDLAYPVAVAAARRWPRRVRVILQRSEPGANPKVNQLCTLAAAARHDILVVSDSNVRVDGGYLWEIASALSDGAVGLVTHPVVGVGEARLGSLLDNLHLASSVGAGMVGAHRVARKDIVVGKSMALRRHDLDALGGFESLADVLAEDYVMGKRVGNELGKRVAMAHRPVANVSVDRGVRDFFARYRRWSVIHRQAIGGWVYAGQLLLNPVAVATLAFFAAPGRGAAEALGTVVALKAGYDVAALRLLRGRAPLSALFASPLKDAILAAAWLHGLYSRTVVWRGNRLRVLPGTRLAPNCSPVRHQHVTEADLWFPATGEAR
jgi:ceramide glucosyltransferase